MNHLIALSLKEAKSLDDINKALYNIFKTDNHSNSRIGYVSGIITAKGKEKSPIYITRLAQYTEYLRQKNNFHIFSATDIFTEEVFKNTNAYTISGAEFKLFWKEMLEMGFVTDIFMTPEWDIPNSGAEDEHNVAKRLGIKIHYVDPIQEIENTVNDL